MTDIETNTGYPNRELLELSILLDISKSINSTMDLKKLLEAILDVLDNKMGMRRGTVTLLKPHTEEINIEVAHGMSAESKKKGTYKIGEGIVGKVVESGKEIVIKDITKDPRFLDKTKARQLTDGKTISFVCVPIKINQEVAGTLSIDKEYATDQEQTTLEQDVRLLSIIAPMLGQAIKIQRTISGEREKLRQETEQLRNKLHEKFNITNIIGKNSQMQEVYIQINQAASGNASVMIRGESGTGKELVANAIHYNSIRAAKPFIKVNCAAIPSELIESELFGHEQGSFTGAIQQKKGKFELAHGGTIFLDEIGDLTLNTQVKLLRVLQEKEFERVGGTETIKANFRLVSATNKNLEQMVKDGSFREDLYYRLNVFGIFMPPLRERKTDILLLAEHFLQKYAEDNNKHIQRLSTPAIDLMMAYHWPGNVRELENCIERAVLVCESDTIHSHHLPPSLQMVDKISITRGQNFEDKVSAFEKELIVDALKATRGNVTKAAEELGSSVRILGYKLKKFNINYKDYR